MRMLTACLVPASILVALAACRPAQEAATPPTPAPAPSAEAPAAAEDITTTDPIAANFRCGDLLVGARFDNAAGKVTLSINTMRRQLAQATAASGARYADDAGNEFWNKGDSATLTLDGLTHECSVTDQVSPWDAARERGIVFRAIGNEPGWLVEVAGGDVPSLQAQLNFGEKTVDASPVTRTAEGFSATATDGAPVTLKVTEGDCSDGMSDQTFPASVELRVGADTFKGCGAFLDR